MYGDELDEDEPRTYEDRMLAHMARQTKAQESMQTIMWWSSALTVIAAVVIVAVLLRGS